MLERRSLLALALLCTTALTPTEALADPVTAALLANGVGLTTALTATATGTFLLNLATAVILSLVSAALAPKPKQPNLKREIAQPQSRQPYRFVYGRNRIFGSPLPLRVKDDILYGCLLLNSRPSEGNFALYVDKRPATMFGDPYDFTGTGGELVIEDFEDFDDPINRPRVWFSRGDKTTPPDTLVSEAPEFFTSADGWQGRTVMWFRFRAGSTSLRQSRWPAVPPQIEVEGDWSKVWDPRDIAQDPDDPDTWTFSDNQALCLLDALRQNPIRRYTADTLHLPSFIEGANVADQEVPLFYATNANAADITVTPGSGILGFGAAPGGALAGETFQQTELRYRVSGFLVWDGGELLDQIAPLVIAGGGDLVRIGGRLGYAAGAYRAPSYTITDFIDEGGIDLRTLAPGRDLPRAVRASYINPLRDWQEAEVPELAVVGGQGIGDEGIRELDCAFVTSPTQAMRLQQIEARKLALQRRLSLVLWPDAFNVVAGATVEINLPAPLTRLNGLWQVQSANPGLWASDDGGVAMRVPVSLRQITEAVYDWTPSTDEFAVYYDNFDPTRAVFVDSSLALPTDLTAVAGGSPGQILLSVKQASSSFIDGVEIFWSLTNDVATSVYLTAAYPGANQTALYTHLTSSSGPHYYWARSIREPSSRSNFTTPSVTATPL